MEHELPWIVKSLLALLGGFVAYFVKLNRDDVKDLQTKHNQLAEELDAINVLVAGKYVHRDEFARVTESIDKKLDKIYDVIHTKEDKKRQ